jgi:hypothetical protein
MLAAPQVSGSSISGDPVASSSASVTAASSNVTTTGGTINALPLWTTATNVQSSALTQTGNGTTAKIGIGTTAPATTLDVKGAETVRGALGLPAIGTATATKGVNSQPVTQTASAYNSGTGTAVAQNFRWQAEPVGNNTSAASGTFNLLYSSGANAPAETGFNLSSKGILTFAPGQTFPGTGTGTVTSAALSAPSSDFTVTGSPVTRSGTLEFSWIVPPTSNNVANAIVKRDGNGNVIANTISANTIYTQEFESISVFADNGSGYAGDFENDSLTIPTMYAFNGQSASIVFEAAGNGGDCEVDTSGNFACTGSIEPVVSLDGGTRKVGLSAIESPKNWFEDAGTGQLVNGSAVVALDPDYVQTVNTDIEYQVFLTPYGDCRGLYVSHRTANSFEVHELGGGTAALSFGYRIMALRKNYENIRFPDHTNDPDARKQMEKLKGAEQPSKSPAIALPPQFHPAARQVANR